MHAADVADAFHMLSDFLGEDEHYLASSQAYGDLGMQGLNNALDLFLERAQWESRRLPDPCKRRQR